MTIRHSVPAVGLVLLIAAQGAAQTAVPAVETAASRAAPGWTAWLGCWSPDGVETPVDRMLCILPMDDATSVRLLTVTGSEIVEDVTLTADGVARPVADGGCEGTEAARWSRDGRRVFITTEMTCPASDRTEAGVFSFVGVDEWVDAHALTVVGQHAARVIRYRAVDRSAVPISIAAELPVGQDLAIEAARLTASAPLDVDEIIEAAELLAAPALDALLAARGTGFDLDARRLTRLDDAGVEGSTIDVMVALTYPEAFQVRDFAGDPALAAGVTPDMFGFDCRRGRMTSRAYRNLCMDPFGYGYFDSYYGYSPLGFSRYGFDPYRWRFGSPIVVVVRPDGDLPPPEAAPTMVPGRGYTRGGAPASSTGAQPRSTAPAATPSTSSGGSSTSSSAGSSGSSGSSGSTPARTAVPRNQ